MQIAIAVFYGALAAGVWHNGSALGAAYITALGFISLAIYHYKHRS